MLSIGAAGCREVSYPPPPQRAETTHPIMAVLQMTGGRPEEAWASIVSGVAAGDPKTDWRWTGAHSTFRLNVDRSIDWKLNVCLTVAQTVLSKVGSQRVAFYVNG